MTGDIPPPADDPMSEELRVLGKVWLPILMLGIAMIVLGTLAIMASFVATLTITITFGILLAVAGVVQIATSLWVGQWRGFLLQLLLGILYLIAGCVMIKHPLRAAAGITIILAVAYMVGGLMRIAFAVTHHTTGRAWILVNGIITLVLGIAIWWEWPSDSLMVIGLLVGIDLLFHGWSWVMLGFAFRPRRSQAV
jgi:uncharacterized membrane protein HdeD (DUF308 family)